MFNSISRKLSKLICLLLLPTPVFAATFGMDFLVNGFGTVCASKSDLPRYGYAAIPYYPFGSQLGIVAPYVANTPYVPSYIGAQHRWNFLANSKFGLQFTALFNDKFKAVTQLVGRSETMNNDNFHVKMDWAYLQYNPTNELDFQFGRFRVPSFYYSDYLDVNHAQPWVSPPEEVYYIVGNAFSNMNGIKARYAYYFGNWTMNSKLWFGSMDETLNILAQSIFVKVQDVVGGNLQIETDRFSVQASLMRSIYNTSLYDSLSGLVAATQIANGGPFPAAQNLSAILKDMDVPIIYLGLALTAKLTDNFDLLVERASILSDGIISTARAGWYGSLTYSLDKYALTFTYGYSRPLQTEINKYYAVANFFNSPQYLNTIDKKSGAGQAVTNFFQAYLGEQRSLALDARYDILPSLSLKGSVKCVTPVGQNNMPAKYILNLVRTAQTIWVYRVSLDFVF